MNFNFNIIKYRYHLSTIFLIILGICLNLPINKNLKLSLLILGVVICIFEPMLALPFILVIFVMYNLNTKIKKLNRTNTTNNTLNENTIETFTVSDNNIISFINDTTINFSQTDFADTINPKNRTSLFQHISGINNPNIYRRKIEFIDELLKTYFFSLEDYVLITNLVNTYENYDELHEILEFTDITLEQGYNDDAQRNAQVPLLENQSLKKLGIFFFKNKNLKYVKYLIGNIYQLGLYGVLNNGYKKDDILGENNYVSGNNILTDNRRRVNYQTLKNTYIDNDSGYKRIIKLIKELILLIFYYKNKSITDDETEYYDFNKVINLENTLNIFEIFDSDYITNTRTSGSIENKINTIIDAIESYNLVEKRNLRYDNNGRINRDIVDTSKSKKLFVDFSFNENANLAAINTRSKLENELNTLFNNLLNNFDNIKVLSTKLYNITDRRQRKRQELDIYNNLSLIYFLTNDSIQTLINNIFRDNTKVRLINSLYRRKKNIFDRQISNEEKMKEKYQFSSGQDLFYDNLFYYIKLKRGSTEILINKIYPQPENIDIDTGKVAVEEVSAPGPAVGDDEEDPFSRVQQREFELGLDDYLTEDKLKDKQEEELTKYYQFLDKENYTKIETLNKLAEERNENLKIEKLSLNKVVDSFGNEIFNIIDEVNELFQRTFNPRYTPSISPGPSIEEFHSGLFTSPNSPSPSFTISGKDNLHKYAYFLKELIKILTKEERIFHVGFIMVLMGLIIYFIDNDNDNYQSIQQPKNLGILQYL